MAVDAFIGFGFRRLFNALAGTVTSTGASGYDRESRYYYMPLALDARLDLHNSWLINPVLEYDLLLRGQQISYLSDVGLRDVTNNQNSGYGLRISMRIVKSTKYLNLFVEPFMRYWHIGQSSINGGGFEPENNTREIGSKLGIEF